MEISSNQVKPHIWIQKPKVSCKVSLESIDAQNTPRGLAPTRTEAAQKQQSISDQAATRKLEDRWKTLLGETDQDWDTKYI